MLSGARSSLSRRMMILVVLMAIQELIIVQSFPTHEVIKDVVMSPSISQNRTLIHDTHENIETNVKFVLKENQEPQRGSEQERYALNTMKDINTSKSKNKQEDSIEPGTNSEILKKSDEDMNNLKMSEQNFLKVIGFKSELSPQETSAITEHWPSYIKNIFLPLFPEMEAQNYIKDKIAEDSLHFQSSSLEKDNQHDISPISRTTESQIQINKIDATKQASLQRKNNESPIYAGPSLHSVPTYFKEFDIPYFV